ncbi:Pullulanase 1, chloroplastic-like protein [Drosera capensis]
MIVLVLQTKSGCFFLKDSADVRHLRKLSNSGLTQALNRIGLHVVMDVVYNHVHGSEPSDEISVLNKIVSGYYLRRDADGNIENSTCCNNTVSEHYMVEHIIVDDLLNWAVKYKVLHTLTKVFDGIDGSSIYLLILIRFLCHILHRYAEG